MSDMSQKGYMNFSDARKFACTLGLKGKFAWEKLAKSDGLPIGIPRHPSSVYAKKRLERLGIFSRNEK